MMGLNPWAGWLSPTTARTRVGEAKAQLTYESTYKLANVTMSCVYNIGCLYILLPMRIATCIYIAMVFAVAFESSAHPAEDWIVK